MELDASGSPDEIFHHLQGIIEMIGTIDCLKRAIPLDSESEDNDDYYHCGRKASLCIDGGERLGPVHSAIIQQEVHVQHS
jgi:hypothetical protein